MNKPCEHCNKADVKKEGYFKCESPCVQAKECYESDKILFDILRGNAGIVKSGCIE